MKTEPTIRCDETTIEEKTARRDAILVRHREILVKLRDARSVLDGAERDMREANAGSRWGKKLTPHQTDESKRILRRAIEVVRKLKDDADITESELKQANIDLAAALFARSQSTASQREEQRASKKAERRSSARHKHEERIIVLLTAARGVAGGTNPELWASRLRSAVESLAYCDTMIEGEAVEMPWD